MKTSPLVSIILPTLNSSEFLVERIDSILKQTYTNWELIVGDSDSTDGTKEILSSLSDINPKVSVNQVPLGLYKAWNCCIEKAHGEYVYIATSDDLMKNNCLEKMVKALEKNPECDICDSVLELIDESGREILKENPQYIPHFWHVNFPRDVEHIRMAPHDFYSHLGGKTVYTSLTQLLIRRKLFEETGLFPIDFGSSADYLWGLRASLHANIIFLPEKLASWRIHSNQATSISTADKIDENFLLMSKMARVAINSLENHEVLTEATKIFKLISFKEILLPAKRKRNTIHALNCSLKALVRHPLFLFEFSFNFIRLKNICDRKFRMIMAYDFMILRRTKKLKLEKIIVYPRSSIPEK